MNRRRTTISLSTFVGGLLAAAILPLAIANADDTYLIYAPDTSTFDPTSAQGYPPLVDVLQGTESWGPTDAPSNVSIGLDGVDTQTTFGSFTNNDFLVTDGNIAISISGGETPPVLPEIPGLGAEIDLANFSGGFENEWIDIPAYGTTAASITDTLITPFGDFNFPL